MNTATDSLETNTPKTGGGITIGQSATADYVGFFAATPIVQPTSASQAVCSAITNSAGGTGAYGTGIQALSATYNSTLIADAIKTLSTGHTDLRTLVLAMRSALVDLGLIKGS